MRNIKKTACNLPATTMLAALDHSDTGRACRIAREHLDEARSCQRQVKSQLSIDADTASVERLLGMALGRYQQRCGAVLGTLGRIVGRQRRRRPGRVQVDPNRADYTQFVVTPSGRIVSGWEYRSDADDANREWIADGADTRVVSLRTLTVDPLRDDSWIQGDVRAQDLRGGPRRRRR